MQNKSIIAYSDFKLVTSAFDTVTVNFVFV